MKPRKAKKKVITLSVIILASGNLALWFLSPLLFAWLGGINLLSFSLIVAFASFFVLVFAYIFRYAQGKPPRRWHVEVGVTYALLSVIIGLALFYDMTLPPTVPAIWRFFILPTVTVAFVFYLLRRIPKIKKKFDEMSTGW